VHPTQPIASIFVTNSESNHSFQSGHMHSNTGSIVARWGGARAGAAWRAAAGAGLCDDDRGGARAPTDPPPRHDGGV
jgi:hypothetical protein